MGKQVDRLDDNTIQITEIQTTQTVSTYIYEDLVLRRDALIAEQKQYNAQKDQEILDADALIKQADGLGVTVKVSGAIPI